MEHPTQKWRLSCRYHHLPSLYYSEVSPMPVRSPQWLLWNEKLATNLGIDVAWFRQEGLPLLAGNACLIGSRPLAQAYAGHQFGHFTMLGDGRAVLLGEHALPTGEWVDVHLKGSGRTPYSRGGDGRAVIGPMVREYVISEAMHALGIPTTRSLAVVATGERVMREQSLPGAVLTRIATSHVRVGTFQYAMQRGRKEDVQQLVDYAIQRHDPHRINDPDRCMYFLQAVIARQASLIAQWQSIGFVHGVMNTDNMTISGETIDYGPCAFIDRYDPQVVFSSIDTGGRYAFCNQPRIGGWNVARFAESLIPLLHENVREAMQRAQEAIDEYASLYQQAWITRMRHKIGLFDEEREDAALIEQLLKLMQQHGADYTNTFIALTTGRYDSQSWFRKDDFIAWRDRWEKRKQRQPIDEDAIQTRMRTINPSIIPRNQFVQEAIDDAENTLDLSKAHRLLSLLAHPFAYTDDHEAYAHVLDQPYRTFCGT